MLATPGLTGTIHSDCQGLIRKLLHPYDLRRNATGPGCPLLRYCVNTIRHHPIQLCWTRSHPQRSNVPPTAGTNINGVSSQQTGSAAHNPAHNPDLPTLHRFTPITHQTIAKGAITPKAWSGQRWDRHPYWAASPGPSTIPPSTPARTTVTTPERSWTPPPRNGGVSPHTSHGSRRGRSVPWAKRSYTSFTSTNPSKNGPTLDGTMDSGTPTPHPRSSHGMHPTSRSTDPRRHQHAGRHLGHPPLVTLSRSTGGLQH